jgi:hypothetical protein
MISIYIDGIEYRFFDHLYSVSKCGKVMRKLKPYSPTSRPDGYLCLGRQRLMHRVVATCWLEKPEDATQVHHKNHIKSDNRADNLEWLTPKVHFSDRHNGESGRYVRTAETRLKISAWRTGRKDSEETRLLKAVGLATNCPKTPCTFQGIAYPSIAAGARAANIHPTTFRLRCHSKNFPEYQFT